MNSLESFASYARKSVKLLMRRVAAILHKTSGGRIHPNHVTLMSLLGHVGVAVLIATRHPIWAGGLLIVFGLMDAVDGELARLQNKATRTGMLLDSVSDRAKEVLLYIGVAYFYVILDYPFVAIWAVAACGISLLVSYINAWGEVVMTTQKQNEHSVNISFRSGLMSYDIRMFLFVVGLFTSLLPEMLILIVLLASYTAISRLVFVARRV
jgi:CDP-diacylglycerol--glycerol-3-phosphate 3-phosphatidyltransferase